MKRNDFAGIRMAITGGTAGLGLAAGAGVCRSRSRRRIRRPQTGRRRAGVAGIRTCSRDHRGHLRQRGHPPHSVTNTRGSRRLDVADQPMHRISDRYPCNSSRIRNVRIWSGALATNVLGPFRLTRALLGSLAAAARENRGAVVLNVSSDAAVTPYRRDGALTAEAKRRCVT